jgi:hypothetical protein
MLYEVPRDYPMLDKSPAEDVEETIALTKLANWLVALCPSYGTSEDEHGIDF